MFHDLHGKGHHRESKETPTGGGTEATLFWENAMRLVLYAFVVGLLLGFGLGRAEAQIVEGYSIKNAGGCWYKNDKLLKTTEAKEAPTHFCLFTRKDGDDENFYVFVTTYDNDEPFAEIRVPDENVDNQQVVWRKEVI